MSSKRYQVFVSSTFHDLLAERSAVSHALLQLNCIPSGMELFPATDQDQWTLIKRVIDDCDYYIVIIGGRYGSIGRNGQSYTEMEYNYAQKQKKPIIAFIHQDASKLPNHRKERLLANRLRLDAFISRAKQKTVRFWKTPGDLSSAVATSIVRLIKDYPAEGLVRPSEAEAFIVRGYSYAMSYLEGMAENARYRLWTVRTHAGEGVGERRYFEIIAKRLASRSRPLEDFRRIIRVTPKSRAHLIWLVDHISQYSAAKVYYFEADGPQFDFLTVDGEAAAIGFTMSGGGGDVGGVVLKRHDAVVAVDAVFSELERVCTLLFEGHEGVGELQKSEMRHRIDLLLAKCDQKAK